MSQERIFYNLPKETIIAKPDLFGLLEVAFGNKQLAAKTLGGDFSDSTTVFDLKRRGVDLGTVEVHTTQEVIQERLSRICNVLTDLKLRREDNDKPFYTLHETYRAASVVVSNWISIHGVVDDGNGRSAARLYELAMHNAGYPLPEDALFDKRTGIFSMNKTVATLFSGSPIGAMRIAATFSQMYMGGEVDECLLDPCIITDKRSRRKANMCALKQISRFAGKYTQKGNRGGNPQINTENIQADGS